MTGRVVVHSLDDARAAVTAAEALDCPVTLVSAPRAGGFAGPRWFLAVVAEATAAYPGARIDAVLDCGDEAGTTLAALRVGCRRVRFTGGAELRTKLAEIAAALGAAIEDDEADPVLDLLGQRDAEAACRAFLAPGGTLP